MLSASMFGRRFFKLRLRTVFILLTLLCVICAAYAWFLELRNRGERVYVNVLLLLSESGKEYDAGRLDEAIAKADEAVALGDNQWLPLAVYKATTGSWWKPFIPDRRDGIR